MIAGTLELQMLTNLAQLSRDMASAKSIVGESMGSINKSIATVKSGFQTLAAGLSVGVFVNMINSTITAMERLHDLSKSTNIAASDLAGLQLLAKQSGTDLDSLAKAINRMTVSIGKSPDEFRKLGITAKDSTGQLMQMSDLFLSLTDVTQRNALAQKVFSKSWAEVAPILAEGSAHIGEIITRGTTLAGITDEMAKKADEFKDKMHELELALQGNRNTIVSRFLPGMTEASKAITQAAEDSGLLLAGWVALGSFWPTLFGGVFGEPMDKVRDMNREIVHLADDIIPQLRQQVLVQQAIGSPVKKWEEDLNRAEGMVKALQLAVRAMGGEFQDQVSRMQNQGKGKTPLDSEEAARRAAKFLQTRKESENASDNLIATLQKELQKTTDLYVVDEKYKETLIELNKLKKEGKIIDEASAIRLAHEIDAKKRIIEANKFLAEQHQADIDFVAKQGDALASLSNDWADATEELDQEFKLLGKSNLERQMAVLLEKRRLDLIAAGNSAAAIRDINLEYEKQIMLLKKIDEFQKAMEIWNKIGDAAGQFFSDLFMHGKSAIDGLRSMIKQLAADLIAFFAKRWLLQMVAGVAGGGTAMGAAANGALGTMGNSAMGLATNAAMSYVGSAMSTYAGSMVGVIGTELSANVATLGVAMDAGAAAVGGFSEVVAAAIPVIGWIVAIGLVLYAIFGNKGGAPKGGGSFFGAFDQSGQMTSNLTGGLDRSRHLQDETQNDSMMRSVVQGVAMGFAGALAHYGGTSNGMQFGLGYNMDKGGTAQSMVSSLVRDATGRTIFEQSNRNVGRKDEEVSAELKLQSERSILAALQASDLPASISHILRSLDAATATEDALNNIYALADAFQMLQISTSRFDLDMVVKDFLKGPNERFHDMGTALTFLGHNTSMTIASIQNMTQATANYRQQVAQMVQAFEQAKLDITAMYADTSRNIRMAGMTPQQQYEFFQNEAANLLGQIQNSTSAAEITSLTQRINSDIMSAFNLLSPEQQMSMQQDFLTRITSTDATTHSRLEEVQKATVDEANRVLKEIHDIMDEAATKIKDAGTSIESAANNQHVDVDIHVQDDRINSVVTESG